MIDRKTTAPSLAVACLACALALPACGGTDEGRQTLSPCGFNEPASNQTFDTAARYGVGDTVTGCLTAGDATGTDFYLFEDPGDSQAGGWVQFRVDGVGAGRLRAVLYGTQVDAELGRIAAADTGASLTFIVPVTPGSAYHLALQDDGGFTAPYAYTVSSTFTDVPDAHEPNDTAATATTMGLAGPMNGYLFAAAGAGRDAYDDYFKLPLTEGQTSTVRWSNLPANLAGRLFIYGPDGVEIARVSSGHVGEALSMVTPSLLMSGDYVVRLGLFADPATGGLIEGTMPPDNFTRAYELIVTQP